ncbi:MAG TPA: hypothetical protein VLD19_07840 [Chitinophagaceae bacterium]|nr:hypothetical protein [Chitinophagaceae bacterium]
MKLVFFLASCFLLASCQKELSYEVDPGNTGGSGGGSGSSGGNSNGTYYIKGKKDGTAFSFNNFAMAKVIDNSSLGGGISLLLVSLASSNGSSLEGLTFNLNFPTASSVPIGTFSETDNGPDHLIAGVYNPNSQTVVYNAGVFPNTVLPLKVTLLTKTSGELTGKFEGAFYKTDASGMTSEHYTITEGEFKLPIQ